jgi:hypothetical protein
MYRSTHLPRSLRRRVLLALMVRVDRSFPEDWDSALTVKQVVRRWIQTEADR